MKKLLLVAAVLASVVLVGCARCKPSCKGKNARVIKGNPPINNSRITHCDYCEVIGVKLVDPDVMAGKEKTFEDGIIIRNLPASQITREGAAPAAAPAPAPAAAPAAN